MFKFHFFVKKSLKYEQNRKKQGKSVENDVFSFEMTPNYHIIHKEQFFYTVLTHN